MAKEKRYSEMKGEWQKLLLPLGGNPELDYLQTQRARLTELLNQAVDITNKQNALAASKQDLSQQLRVIMVEGQRMATLLRKSIAAHYGVRAEKLAEFGLQPFRGRTRIEKPAEPKPQEKKAPAPTEINN
jgi:hypothetical protein